jgi:hypothetical protein
VTVTAVRGIRDDGLSEIPRTRMDPFADISKAESATQCSEFNAYDRTGSAVQYNRLCWCGRGSIRVLLSFHFLEYAVRLS